MVLTLVSVSAKAGEKPKELQYPVIGKDGTFTIHTSGKPIEGRLEGDCRFYNDPGPPEFLEYSDGTVVIKVLRTLNGNGFWVRGVDLNQIDVSVLGGNMPAVPAVLRYEDNGVKVLPPSGKEDAFFRVKIKPRKKK